MTKGGQRRWGRCTAQRQERCKRDVTSAEGEMRGFKCRPKKAEKKGKRERRREESGEEERGEEEGLRAGSCHRRRQASPLRTTESVASRRSCVRLGPPREPTRSGRQRRRETFILVQSVEQQRFFSGHLASASPLLLLSGAAAACDAFTDVNHPLSLRQPRQAREKSLKPGRRSLLHRFSLSLCPLSLPPSLLRRFGCRALHSFRACCPL